MGTSMPPEPEGHAKRMVAICSDRRAFDAEVLDRTKRYITVHAMELGLEHAKVPEEQTAYWTRTIATIIVEIFTEADLVFVPRDSLPGHVDDDDDDDW